MDFDNSAVDSTDKGFGGFEFGVCGEAGCIMSLY